MNTSRFWQIIAAAAVLGLFYVGWGLSRNRPASALDLFSTQALAADSSPLIEEFQEQNSTYLKLWSTDDQGNLHYRIVRLLGFMPNSRDLRSTIIPELVTHVEFTAEGKRVILAVSK